MNRRRVTGARVRQARKIKNMTQPDLANRLGVGQTTISAWERLQERLNDGIDELRQLHGRDDLAVLAEALGTAPEFLQGHEDDMRTELVALRERQAAIAAGVAKNLRAMAELF